MLFDEAFLIADMTSDGSDPNPALRSVDKPISSFEFESLI